MVTHRYRTIIQFENLFLSNPLEREELVRRAVCGCKENLCVVTNVSVLPNLRGGATESAAAYSLWETRPLLPDSPNLVYVRHLDLSKH